MPFTRMGTPLRYVPTGEVRVKSLKTTRVNMTDTISELLDGSDFLSVNCEASASPQVNYQIIGLGDEPKENKEREWKLTGGVEGTFEFTIFGNITYPEKWSGFSCELNVNNLGSEFRVDHQTDGYLGDGWQKDKSVLLRLYVKPSIAKDILDKIFVYDPANSDNGAISFRADLMNLKPGINRLEGAIVYQIIRVYF